MAYQFIVRHSAGIIQIKGDMEVFKTEFKWLWRLTQDDLIITHNEVRFDLNSCEDSLAMLMYLKDFTREPDVEIINDDAPDVVDLIEKDLADPCVKLVCDLFKRFIWRGPLQPGEPMSIEPFKRLKLN